MEKLARRRLSLPIQLHNIRLGVLQLAKWLRTFLSTVGYGITQAPYGHISLFLFAHTADSPSESKQIPVTTGCYPISLEIPFPFLSLVI